MPGFGGPISLLMTVAYASFERKIYSPRFSVIIGSVEPTAANGNLPSVLGMDFLQHFRLTISVRDAHVELDPRS